MRVYREYSCDHGHHWTLFCQDGDPESEADALCPHGHEAVTCAESLPADEVQILFRPAAQIVDRVTGQVHHADRYFLVLLDRADREFCVSTQHYDWDEVVKLALLFRGKDEERALLWWKRRMP